MGFGVWVGTACGLNDGLVPCRLGWDGDKAQDGGLVEQMVRKGRE
jgi:hypothetical protein